MPEKHPDPPFPTRPPDDVRVDPEALARSVGLAGSGPGRASVIDELREAKGGPAGGRGLAAPVTAAPSEATAFDRAKELVAHHPAPEPAVSPRPGSSPRPARGGSATSSGGRPPVRGSGPRSPG